MQQGTKLERQPQGNWCRVLNGLTSVRIALFLLVLAKAGFSVKRDPVKYRTFFFLGKYIILEEKSMVERKSTVYVVKQADYSGRQLSL